MFACEINLFSCHCHSELGAVWTKGNVLQPYGIILYLGQIAWTLKMFLFSCVSPKKENEFVHSKYKLSQGRKGKHPISLKSISQLPRSPFKGQVKRSRSPSLSPIKEVKRRRVCLCHNHYSPLSSQVTTSFLKKIRFTVNYLLWKSKIILLLYQVVCIFL